MTEVALTDPALVALFGELSQALAKTQGEETQKQDFQGSGLLLALVAWHDGKAVSLWFTAQRGHDPSRN
ncbi:MAG: hypothetical protein U5L01_18285 [Rheinheimera sp.]|nr:hypothetical protein [Rheinheimera sp.]